MSTASVLIYLKSQSFNRVQVGVEGQLMGESKDIGRGRQGLFLLTHE